MLQAEHFKSVASRKGPSAKGASSPKKGTLTQAEEPIGVRSATITIQ